MHVDFENYVDGVIGPLNAGVRFLGHPFSELKQGRVEVVNDAARAFAGCRCGYIRTESADQIGGSSCSGVTTPPRSKATRSPNSCSGRQTANRPTWKPDRVVRTGLPEHPTTRRRAFRTWTWAIVAYQGSAGGITLLANGSAADGTYGLDVVINGLAKQAVKG